MIALLFLTTFQNAQDPALASVERFVAAIQAGQVDQSKEALGDGQVRKVEPVYKVSRGGTFPGARSTVEDLLVYVKPCGSYTVKFGSFAGSEAMRDFTVRWTCGSEKRYAAIVATRDGQLVKVFWGALGFAAPPKGGTFLPAVLKREQGKANG